MLKRPAPAGPIDNFRPRFQSVLQQHGVIGGGFAFVHGSAPADTLVFGEMNSETHQPIDSATAYNWASITKTMTAIAILQLRDRGKLSLDDPAVRYIPELRQVHDQFGTIDASPSATCSPTAPASAIQPGHGTATTHPTATGSPSNRPKWTQVAAMLPYTHIAFAPGTRWSYSNLGYVFLGQIIERLSGDDFEVYIDKNILKPLGMTESYFDRAPYFLESHVSASYLRAGSKLTPQPFNFDTGITTSNSGLKAPVTDMAKYLRFLIGDPGNALYEIVLKRSSLEEAWTGVLPATEPGQTAHRLHSRLARHSAYDGTRLLRSEQRRPSLHLSRRRPGRLLIGDADRSRRPLRQHSRRQHHRHRRSALHTRTSSAIEHRARRKDRPSPDASHMF